MTMRIPALLMALALGAAAPLTAQRQPVRAVLFYSPTCPHCHRVINDVLPGIFARFGGAPTFVGGDVGHVWTNGQLEILLVDATRREGGGLYEAAVTALRLPDDRSGSVPLLICGDSALVGDEEIPAVFPGLIERARATGMAWPAWPGLRAILPPGYGERGAPPAPAAAPDTTAPRPVRPPDVATATTDTTRAFARILRADPAGAVIAIVVLAALAATLLLAPRRAAPLQPRLAQVVVPALIAVGIGVAAYLTWGEATGSAVACGPVGDCHAVQQSRYARVAGVPVAVLGLAGYVAILAAWLTSRFAAAPLTARAARLAFLFALAGTLASALLTFLEPFVIGAVCAWCLTSAVVMAALTWLLAGRTAATVAEG